MRHDRSRCVCFPKIIGGVWQPPDEVISLMSEVRSDHTKHTSSHAFVRLLGEGRGGLAQRISDYFRGTAAQFSCALVPIEQQISADSLFAVLLSGSGYFGSRDPLVHKEVGSGLLEDEIEGLLVVDEL